MGKKKHFFKKDVEEFRKLPSWNEFSVKFITTKKFIPKNMMRLYCPKIAKKVDRKFFWTIWLKVDRANCIKYYEDVLE